MKKSQFNYTLPEDLIAKYPLANRSDSRLLVYDKQRTAISHQKFKSLPEYLRAGDLLVFNDTKVIPARFFGQKETGGKIEFLIERIEDKLHFIAHIKASNAPKINSKLLLENGWEITVLDKQEGLYHCRANNDINEIINEIGSLPLPLYFNREQEDSDINRYQTVYAKHQGSVAAPTAGLHFDDGIFVSLKDSGIHIAYVTLHVGAGTFQPVRVDEIKDHKMHSESYTISDELVKLVNSTKENGGRVIAVGTTVMRSLESAAQQGGLTSGTRDTNIFITPGYEFKICDGLITNFHLPESTLLMLVAAFIGHQQVMDLYSEAIAEKYRFYSYGDASLFL